MDFYDWAVDEGCIAELKEIHQGESAEDKKRIDDENQQRLLEESRKIQKEKNLYKKNKVTEEDKLLKILENKWKITKNSKKKNLNLDKIKKAENIFYLDYKKFKIQFYKTDKYELPTRPIPDRP